MPRIIATAPAQTVSGALPQGLLDARRILVIDHATHLDRALLAAVSGKIVYTLRSLISTAQLRSTGPDAIVAPLITPDWDIVDVAVALETQGYEGPVFALTRRLPRASLIAGELAELCPRLSIHMVETTE